MASIQPALDQTSAEFRVRNNGLGFALLHGLNKGGLVSPLSITIALAMLAGGADAQERLVFSEKLFVLAEFLRKDCLS